MKMSICKRMMLLVVILVVFAGLIGCSNGQQTEQNSTTTKEETTAKEEATTATDDKAPNKNVSEQVVFALSDKLPWAGEKIDNNGIISEIVAEVFKEEGKDYKFEFYPVQRAEKEITDGNAWGSYPYKKTPERESKYLFTDPVVLSATEFFYNKTKFDGSKVAYDKLEELKKYTIVGIKGYFYEKALKDAKLNIEWVTTEEEAIKMLEGGRVQLMISPDAGGIYNIKKFFPDEEANFATLSKPFDPKSPFYIMVSKTYPNSEELVKSFNEGLAKIKQNGKYGEIMKKHGLSE